MKTVDGVYTKEDYKAVKAYLCEHYPQMGLFWVMGVDTGYRVSDMLRLTVSDVRLGVITILERKTNKLRSATLSPTTQDMVALYIAKNGLKNDSYIFWDSRKGVVGEKPMTRQSVWKGIKKAGEALGFPRLNLHHIQHARHLHGLPLFVRPRLT